MKREENMTFENKISFFFQYLKTTFQYQKLYSTPPWHGARTRKYINAFSSYSAKTKHDGQTDGRTDGQTGGIAISPVPVPTAPAGNNKWQGAKYDCFDLEKDL